MKQEAHLYCTLKVATDQDLREQIGPSGQIWFDLVNHDKLPQDHIFRVRLEGELFCCLRLSTLMRLTLLLPPLLAPAVPLR
jgi:hypothetical protein